MLLPASPVAPGPTNPCSSAARLGASGLMMIVVGRLTWSLLILNRRAVLDGVVCTSYAIPPVDAVNDRREKATKESAARVLVMRAIARPLRLWPIDRHLGVGVTASTILIRRTAGAGPAPAGPPARAIFSFADSRDSGLRPACLAHPEADCLLRPSAPRGLARPRRGGLRDSAGAIRHGGPS